MCVGTPQFVCVVCFRGLRRQARVFGTPQSVCVVCFRELSRQTRVLVHLSMFVLDVSGS